MDVIAETLSVEERRDRAPSAPSDSLKPGRQVLILGRGAFAMTCWDILSKESQMAGRVVGLVDQAGTEQATRPVVGSFAELPDLVKRYKVGMIVVCLDDRRAMLPMDALLELKVGGIDVVDGHRLFEQLTGRLSIDSLRPSALIFSAGFKRQVVTIWIDRKSVV